MKNCRICNKELGLYATSKQIYCGNGCKKIAQKVKQNVKQQGERFSNPLQICRRCKSSFKIGSNKNCPKCEEIMMVKKEYSTCSVDGCDIRINAEKTMCYRHKTLHEKALKREEREHVRVVTKIGIKPRGVSVKKSTIPERFLVRGNISAVSSGLTQFG